VDGSTSDEPSPRQESVIRANLPVKPVAPNVVVFRATSLPGVAAAWVASPDGRLVAARVPIGSNEYSLSNLSPWLFSEMNEQVKELKMGELTYLHFTLGTVPWIILPVSNVFFAAFGYADRILPASDLAALATSLGDEIVIPLIPGQDSQAEADNPENHIQLDFL
jgi:predicted regulator of Ras-like GTPase activity (Roadblock/LC7/MglB family)